MECSADPKANAVTIKLRDVAHEAWVAFALAELEDQFWLSASQRARVRTGKFPRRRQVIGRLKKDAQSIRASPLGVSHSFILSSRNCCGHIVLAA